MDRCEKGQTVRFSIVTRDATGAAVAADSTPQYRLYKTPSGSADLGPTSMTAGDRTGHYFVDVDLGDADFSIGDVWTLVIDGTVGGTTDRVAIDFEVSMGLGRLNNTIGHDVATGVDTVYERDGTTAMRALTPSESNGVITMSPGAPGS